MTSRTRPSRFLLVSLKTGSGLGTRLCSSYVCSIVHEPAIDDGDIAECCVQYSTRSVSVVVYILLYIFKIEIVRNIDFVIIKSVMKELSFFNNCNINFI